MLLISKITNLFSKTNQKFKIIHILHVKLMLVNINEYLNFKKVKNFTPPHHLELKSHTVYKVLLVAEFLNEKLQKCLYEIYINIS